LDFNRLSSNFDLLGFEIDALRHYRIRIDKEVVGNYSPPSPGC